MFVLVHTFSSSSLYTNVEDLSTEPLHSYGNSCLAQNEANSYTTSHERRPCPRHELRQKTATTQTAAAMGKCGTQTECAVVRHMTATVLRALAYPQRGNRPRHDVRGFSAS